MTVLDQDVVREELWQQAWSRSWPRPLHPWLQRIRVTFVPGSMTPLLGRIKQGLMDRFALLGHELQEKPDDDTSVVLTTARLGEVVSWRKSLILVARRRFHLTHTPHVFTLVHATPDHLRSLLRRLATALGRDPVNPEDFAYPGLGPRAPHVLIEQGQRGGPMLALERLVQAQAKGIRVILVVGEEEPEEAYHFDLAGAHARTSAADPETFYTEIALRIATTASTGEVTAHQVLAEPVPAAVWSQSGVPRELCVAGRELGKRNFFTEMIRVADLVYVPSVSDAIASQYSEGCFGSWDPALDALVATATGSARPVDKGNLSLSELAVISGARPGGQGALVRPVEGRPDVAPSSEAVEMVSMDEMLPRITLGGEWDATANVPVARSKLHGHRGVYAYDPSRVEFVPLDPPYYHYPVSCATEAQAQGIRAAFGRAQSLRDPDDPRKVAFTVLPGHGVVIVEKWVPHTRPLQTIWEYMDAGYLQIQNRIPQGTMRYVPEADGRMRLEEP